MLVYVLECLRSVVGVPVQSWPSNCTYNTRVHIFTPELLESPEIGCPELTIRLHGQVHALLSFTNFKFLKDDFSKLPNEDCLVWIQAITDSHSCLCFHGVATHA
jgi:hypothetical protein